MSPDETNYIYIVATVKDGIASAPVKVGITKSISTRFNTLKTASAYPLEVYAALPFPSREDAQKLEWAFHKVMDRRRLNGEWFNIEPHDAMRAMVENIKGYLTIHLELDEDLVNEVMTHLGIAA